MLRNAQRDKGKTYGDIKIQNRQDNIKYNNKVFGNTSIGIHGKDLPQFNENLKEYWKQGNKGLSVSFIDPIKEESKEYIPKLIKKENYENQKN